MNIISIINTKGGVGKTTIAINLGEGLNRLNKSVLLIDLDNQAHLTQSLINEPINKTISSVLEEEATVEDIMIDRQGLKVIPSSSELSKTERRLMRDIGSEFILKRAMESISGFDFILIDCPPSLGILTINALTTCNEVYIPVDTGYLSLNSLSGLLTKIEEIKKKLNKNLGIGGIIVNRFDTRRNLDNEVIELLKKHFGSLLCNTIIRQNISLCESLSFNKTIFEYKKCFGLIDFMALSKEIIGRSR